MTDTTPVAARIGSPVPDQILNFRIRKCESHSFANLKPEIAARIPVTPNKYKNPEYLMASPTHQPTK